LNTEKAVNLTDVGDPDRSKWLFNLGICHENHFTYLKEESNSMAAISAFKEAASVPTAYPSTALHAARKWADISCHSGNFASALDGYCTALEILPRVAWLGLDALSHHDQLLQTRSESLGCLAATCAIQLGHFEEAVELLDLGRSVYWQQVSSLRSDFGALKQKDEGLANDLETVRQQLDAGNLFNSNIISEESIVKSSEDVGRQHRDLVSKWERLVERVRQLPGFTYFLRPTPFHQLRQAITVGQVIVINISELGVDALVFGCTGPIEHVPLPTINLEKFTQMAGNIILNRSADHRSTTDIRATQLRQLITNNLQKALRMVWHKVLVPIFHKIQIPLESNAGLPQHRIWWYPTGPLTFIPIHAAGPDKGSVDVSRMIISSYVTTLDSLLKAQQKAEQDSSGRQRLVAISQPNTPGQSAIPHCTQEVLRVVEGAAAMRWAQEDIVHLHGPDATVEHVLTALDTCSWAHFACHGSQDPVLGMKSAFALHNGHLELGQIVSKQLSVGQFAFLSACHAASGLKELPGEAMHLAAGLQFAGFPSVIATMWGIRDEDAPKVADSTYQYLFRNGMEGLDPSDAATALNRAVLALRKDPDVTIDRWAPFVHFGI
jgi:CHAT domain-containing protein